MTDFVDVVTLTQVQAGELGNVEEPRVRDLRTVLQGQVGELLELGNVLQPVFVISSAVV